MHVSVLIVRFVYVLFLFGIVYFIDLVMNIFLRVVLIKRS